MRASGLGSVLSSPSLTTFRRGGLALVDQVLSSGGTLLLIVLVARLMTPADFGALSIALLIHGFLLGAFRALVGEVGLLRSRRPGAVLGDETRLGLTFALVLGGASAVALALAGWVIGGQTGWFLVLAAIASPITFAQDIQRYLAYAVNDVARAVRLDGIWLGVQVVVSAAIILADRATPTLFLVVWFGGAALSGIYGLLTGPRGPVRSGFRAWYEADRSRAMGFLGDFVVSTGLFQTAFLLVGVLVPLEDFGAIRLAFVSVVPLANLLAGVRVLVLSHLAGSNRGHAARVVTRIAAAYALVAACYGVAVYFAPLSWGELAFGETWREAHAFVPLMAVAELFRLSSFPATDFLKVFAGPSYLLRSRAMVSVAFLGGMIIGGLIGGAYGAVIGLAAATTIGAAIWWSRVLAVHRASAPSSAAPPSPGGPGNGQLQSPHVQAGPSSDGGVDRHRETTET